MAAPSGAGGRVRNAGGRPPGRGPAAQAQLGPHAGAALLLALVIALPPAYAASATQTVDAQYPNAGSTLSTGSGHSCAVFVDGTVKCWGTLGGVNLGGVPAAVSPLYDPMTATNMSAYQVASSRANVCVVTKQRRLFCFGDCTTGVCGTGQAALQPFWTVPTHPVDFAGRLVLQVSASAVADHVCAILDSSELACWGANDAYQLGLGHTTRIGDTGFAFPAGNITLPTGKLAAQVAVGGKHTCVVTTDRLLYCWGSHSRGQLGIGAVAAPTLARSAVAVTLNGGRFATAVACGAEHTCAIGTTGSSVGDIVCFGRGSEGQLGLGNANDVGTGVYAPGVAVPNAQQGGGYAVQITAGAYHTCAVLAKGFPGAGGIGGLWCWGDNTRGAVGVGGGMTTLGAAQAVTASHQIQLGFFSRLGEVAAGDNHTCATLHERIVICWGGGTGLGYAISGAATPLITGAYVGDDEIPALAGVVDLGFPYRTALHPLTAQALDYFTMSTGNLVAVGMGYTCAIDGAAFMPWCFGNNTVGQLGWGNTNAWNTAATPASAGVRPYALMPGGRTVISVSAGTGVTCFLLDNRQVACSGHNQYCQIPGAALGSIVSTPQVIDLGNSSTMTALRIAVGGSHTCVVRADGRVLCWGQNGAGQLGTATTGNTCFPANVLPVSIGVNTASHIVRSLSCGNAHCAAVRATDGRVIVWGDNSFQQHGNTSVNNQNPGLYYAGIGDSSYGSNVSMVAAGYNHVCAQFTAPQVNFWTCWGSSQRGECGGGQSQNVGPGTISPYPWWSPSSWPGTSYNAKPGLFTTGYMRSTGLTSSGTLVGFGSSDYAEAYTVTPSVVSPQLVSLSGSFSSDGSILEFAQGFAATHIMMLFQKGVVGGWGDNRLNQLGTGVASPVQWYNAAPATFPTNVPVGVHWPYLVEGRSASTGGSSAAAGATMDFYAMQTGPPGPIWTITTQGTVCNRQAYPATHIPPYYNTAAPAMRTAATVVQCYQTSAVTSGLTVSWTAFIAIGSASISRFGTAVVTPPIGTITALSRSTALADGSTPLTITGTNLGASIAVASAVFVGGTPATLVTYGSATQLTALVPAGTGLNDTVAVTIGGQALSPTCNVAGGRCVVSYSAPFINLASPATQLIPGMTVSLIGSGFGPRPPRAFNVTIRGVAAGSYWWVSETTVRLIVPADATINMPVAVFIDGQWSNSNVTISGQQPVVYSVTPSSCYRGKDASVTRTFVITGFNLGAVSADVGTVSIGGRACPTITWVNSSYIVCPNVPTNAWNSTNVVVYWGTIASPANTLFTPYGTPSIYNIRPSGGEAGTFININGTWLGTQTSDVLDVQVGGVSCVEFFVVSNSLLQCTVPTGSGAADVVVSIRNWQPVVLISAFLYRTDFAMSINFTTANNTAVVLPSTATAPALFTPSITAKVTDTLGGAAVLAATDLFCSLSVRDARSTLNPTTASQASIVGSATGTASALGNGVSMRWDVGARAPPDTTLYLAVSCSVSGAPSASSVQPLAVYVKTIVPVWTVSPPAGGTAPSVSASQVDAIAPAPQLRILQSTTFGGFSGPFTTLVVPSLPSGSSVSCRIEVGGASDQSVNVIGTAFAQADTNGYVNFTALGLLGNLGAPFQLASSCSWYTADALPAALTAVSTLLDVRLIAGTLPLPSEVLYGTAASAVQIAVRPVNTTTGALQSPPTLPWLNSGDVSCTLAATEAVSGTGVGLATTPSAPAYDRQSAAVNATALRITPQPTDATSYPLNVTITATCRVRQQSVSVPYVGWTIVKLVALQWQTAPPAVIIPSTTSTPVSAIDTLRLEVRHPTSGLLLADSTTRCTLSATIVSSSDGAGSTTLTAGSGATVTTSGGVATWTRIAIATPLGSTFNLTATCTRVEGGPSLRLMATIAAAAAAVDWRAVGGAAGNAPALWPPLYFATPFAVVANVSFVHPVSLSPLAAYNSSQYGASSCTFRLVDTSPAAAEMLLSSGAAGTGAVSVTGIATMMPAIKGPVNTSALFAIACNPLAAETLTASLPFTLQDIRVRWSSAGETPLTLLIPSTRRNPVETLANVAATVTDPSGATMTGDSTSECTLGVTLVRSGLDDAAAVSLQPLGTTQLKTVVAAGVARWASLAVIVPPNSTVTISATCQRALGGNAVATFVTSFVAAASVAWASIGPASQPIGTPPHLRAPVLFNTPYAMTANVTLVTMARAYVRAVDSTSFGASTCTVTVADQSSAVASIAGAAADVSPSTDAYGVVRFRASLQSAPGVPVFLIATCTLFGYALPSSTLEISTTAVTPVWSPGAAPPPVALPSTASRLLALTPQPALRLMDAYGSLVAEDSSTKCSLGTEMVVDEVSVDPEGSFVAQTSNSVAQLVGPAAGKVATAANGVVSFLAAGLAAPFGALLRVNASCTRSQGDALVPLSAAVEIIDLRIAWLTRPTAYSLYNTLQRLAIRLDTFSAFSGRAPYNSTLVGAAKCTLGVDDANGTLADAGIALLGTQNDLVAYVDEGGLAGFNLQLRAPYGAQVPIIVQCSTLGSVIQSAAAWTTMEALQTAWAFPPASESLPSSFGASISVNPAPIIRLSAASGNAVDFSSVACTPAVDLTNTGYTGVEEDAPKLQQTRVGGYYFNASQGGAVLTGIQVAADWGARVRIVVTCVRDEGDTLPPLSWFITMKRPRIAWIQQPPAEFASRQNLDLGVAIIDTATSGLLREDNFTICSVGNAPVGGGTPALATGSDLQVRVGVAQTSVFSLSARPGLTYSITVTCKLGLRLLPGAATATSVVTGCARGYYPVPPDNSTCGICGEGSYSDGGSSSCISCPRSDGITCSAGVPTFHDGFYIAGATYIAVEALGVPLSDTGKVEVIEIALIDAVTGNGTSNDTEALAGLGTAQKVTRTLYPPQALVSQPLAVSAGLEIHACANEACFSDTSNRSFGCLPGYHGALCGVCRADLRYSKQGGACVPCMSQAVNYVLLFIAALFSVVVILYISLGLKFKEDNEARVVWRITVNYLTGLVSLGIFKAKGTETFRSVFNFVTSAAAPGSSGTLDLSPVACELQLSFYTKFYALMALPLSIAGVAVLINVLHIIIKNRKEGGVYIRRLLHNFWQEKKMISVAMVVLSLSYPSLTANAFSVFACLNYKIGGRTYLTGNLDVYCDDAQHALASTLAFVAIGMLVVGFPVAFVYFLYRNQRRVQAKDADKQFFSNFGFLFAGYKADAWYRYGAESFVMLRKAGVVLIGSVMSDPYLQVLTSQVLVLTALTAHFVIMPFAAAELNYIEAGALFCLSITQAVSLAYLRSQTLTSSASATSGEDLQARGRNALLNDVNTTALLLLINITMLVILIVFYFRARQRDMARRLRQNLKINLLDKGVARAVAAAAKYKPTSIPLISQAAARRKAAVAEAAVSKARPPTLSLRRKSFVPSSHRPTLRSTMVPGSMQAFRSSFRGLVPQAPAPAAASPAVAAMPPPLTAVPEESAVVVHPATLLTPAAPTARVPLTPAPLVASAAASVSAVLPYNAYILTSNHAIILTHQAQDGADSFAVANPLAAPGTPLAAAAVAPGGGGGDMLQAPIMRFNKWKSLAGSASDRTAFDPSRRGSMAPQ